MPLERVEFVLHSEGIQITVDGQQFFEPFKTDGSRDDYSRFGAALNRMAVEILRQAKFGKPAEVEAPNGHIVRYF